MGIRAYRYRGARLFGPAAEQCRERTQAHAKGDDYTERGDGGRTFMLAPIAQQVSIPEDLTIADVDSADTVAATM
jgi:hypothetical protein